jgi:basic membrane protein A
VISRAVLVLALIATLLVAVGCSDDDEPEEELPTVLLALARGGLGDQAFNDSADEGLQRAEAELGVAVERLDFDPDDQSANLLTAAEGNYELIIALGAENAAPVTAAAAANPGKRFAILDATAEGDNVTSVTFRELEGDYLAGYLLALLAPTGKVGFIGGADVTVIRRVEHGMTEGIREANRNADIEARFITGKDDFSGFTKPDEAKAIAAELYAGGAEILYVAAGGSALGAIEAAQEAGKPIITTGTDQRHIAPEVVVTSRIKDMGLAVFTTIEQLQVGTLQPGPRELTIADGAVGLAGLDSPLISEEVVAQVEAVDASLRAGRIAVPPYRPD